MLRRTVRILTLTAAASAGIAANVLAEDKTYIGSAGTGSWALNANWTPIGAPEQDDNAFLTPSDASTRIVLFDPSGQFLFPYGTVTVSSSGAGSVTLRNTINLFEAEALIVGVNGAYTQQNNGNASVDATFLNGGTISSNSGTYNAFEVTHTAGQLGGGAYRIGQRYSLQGGLISNATLTNNGTFDFSGGGAAGGKLVNNGTLIMGGSASLNLHAENHGTVVFNSDARFESFTTFVSMTLPAGRLLSTSTSAFGVTLDGGTFTQFGTVRADNFRIRAATWDQRGGFLSANSLPGQVLVGVDGTTGTLLMSGGSAQFSDALKIGSANSIGMFVQSGGQILAIRAPIVGATQGTGSFTKTAGTFNAGGLIVGQTNFQAATFTQTGGVSAIGTLVVAQDASSATTNANLTIAGGTFSVGSTAINNGVITQSGGVSEFAQGITSVGSVVVNGSASLTASHVVQNSVQLAGNGRIATTEPVAGSASIVERLVFDESTGPVQGQWDLGDGLLIVADNTATPIDAVRRYLTSGYAGGSWTGAGLASSAAAATPRTALAYADSGDLPTASRTALVGDSSAGAAVIVAYTLYGDANIDGIVDIGDFALLAPNFNQPSDWVHGDFNYNGTTEFGDFALLLANFNQSLPLNRSAVPEPSIGAMLLALTATVGRRSRSS